MPQKLTEYQCETCDSIMKIIVLSAGGYGSFKINEYVRIYKSEGMTCPVCGNRTLNEREDNANRTRP